MTQAEILILRAALDGAASIHRDIEIESSKSLYKLAQAIVSSFGFDFDHTFGFYAGLTPAKMMRVHPKYELFADMGKADMGKADMGEAGDGALSVKKTKIADAFPTAGHTLLFLFDYGDEWRFRVSLRGTGQKLAKVRYPRIVASKGEAPEQYPDPDDAEDGPRFGFNPVTGEKVLLRGK